MPPKSTKTVGKAGGDVGIQCLVLQQKGTFRQSTISENSCESVAKVLRRAQNPELVGKWEKNDIHILIYGYKKGKEGTENKHELVPPHNDIKLYSDIVLVGTGIDGGLKSFNHESWSRFVASVMGEDSDSNSSEDSEVDSDVEEEEEEEEDVESVVSDKSVNEIELFEEEEEVVVVKKKPKPVKKPNKKLPAYYSTTPLNIESVESDYIIPENKVRQQALKVIQTKLSMIDEKSQQRLEQGIFNATIQTCKNRHIWACYENPDFISMYQITLRKTVTNLDPTSYIKNDGLFELLKSGSYSASDIGSLGAYEMYPDKWRYMIEIQLKRDKHLLEGGTDLEYATDMFRCSRCGKRKCTYYEMQTRGADEPMTVFIKCLVCKKEWKQ